MSMLSSVFARRKNIQKRLNHLTHRTQAKRAHSPPSPASFASPAEPFDPARLYADAARAAFQRNESRGSSTEQVVVAGPSAPRKRMSSPQVELDFGLEDSSLSDWLATDFVHFRADSEPMLRPERNASLGATSTNVSSTMLGGWGSSSGSILAGGSSVAIGSVFGRTESMLAVRQSMPLSAAHSDEEDDMEEEEGGEGHDGGEGFNFGEDEVIVIGAPRGRDATPSPLGSASADIHTSNEHSVSRDQPQRRPAPTPIQIPKRTIASHTHIQRSASLSSLFPREPRSGRSNTTSTNNSRAPSLHRTRTRSTTQRSHSISRSLSGYSRHSDGEIDWEDGLSSAVSGTTLARQLASTYILSPPPTAQRRSKGHLARQDSTTLPRGEYGSLFTRRSVRSSRGSVSTRRSSNAQGTNGNGTETFWRDEAGVPPVPPMPENLSPSFPVSPPLSQESDDGTGVMQVGNSLAALDVNVVIPMDAARSRRASLHEAGLSPSVARRSIYENEKKRRRVSKISEGSTPSSAAPGPSSPSPSKPTTSQVSLPFSRGSETSPVTELPRPTTETSQPADSHDDLAAQDVLVTLSPPAKHSTSPDAPTTATSSSMSMYTGSSTSPPPHGMPTPPHTSSSGSMYSPGSLLATLSPGGTSISFSSISSPDHSFKSPASVTSSIPGSSSSNTGDIKFSPSRPLVSLLPITERPRSTQVPHSPSPQSSRASQDSTGRPRSLSLSSLANIPTTGLTTTSPLDGPESPDLLDIMLFPTSARPPPTASDSASSISTSSASRVGSPPAPISVPRRRSSSAFQIEVVEAHSPTTASAARQTFPETPYAFTPLTGKSFSSPAVPTMTTMTSSPPPPLPRTNTFTARGTYTRHVRGRAGGSREMRLKTLSSPPGKFAEVPFAALGLGLSTMPETPQSTGTESAETSQGEGAGVEVVEKTGLTPPSLKVAHLSIIEEKSAPPTPSSRPASSAIAITPVDAPSPSRKQRPTSLRLQGAQTTPDGARRASGEVARPTSLVPAKRPLTPVPSSSPAESSAELPPTSPAAETTTTPSVHLVSADSSSASRSLQTGTASPAKSFTGSVMSRRPSAASETSLNFLASPSSDAPSARRHTRSRPPPPSGPRKPSTGPGGMLRLRTRNGSVSSQNSSTRPSSRYTSLSLSATSPRFQTVPIRFRGLTMEAAQWTFTSQQLQEVVSVAIKSSSDASAIRLLPMDVAVTQVPEEIQRLEARSAEVRTNYKLAVRRRKSLFGALGDAVESGDAAASTRVLEELSELTENMDHYAEELYAVTDQLGQLSHLRDVHSSSALAMALRKLNTSFVRTIAQKEELRVQIADLEHQRDEAWKQAQDAAEEVDMLQDRIAALEGTTVPTPASSRRSSRVLVARKTSIRVSKAGLRSPSRIRSQRSSRSSMAMASPAIRTGVSEDIPPVPPIPNRSSIGAALSGRSSLGTADFTPSTGTRAMILAQQEVCEMLGIRADELRPPELVRRRSMSFTLDSPVLPDWHDGMPVVRRNSDTPSPRSRWEFYRHSRSLADDKLALLAGIGVVSPRSSR